MFLAKKKGDMKKGSKSARAPPGAGKAPGSAKGEGPKRPDPANDKPPPAKTSAPEPPPPPPTKASKTPQPAKPAAAPVPPPQPVAKEEPFAPATILLLGGYGAVGSAIAKTLLEQSSTVTLLVAGRSIDKASALCKQLNAQFPSKVGDGRTKALTADASDSASLTGCPRFDVIVNATTMRQVEGVITLMRFAASKRTHATTTNASFAFGRAATSPSRERWYLRIFVPSHKAGDLKVHAVRTTLGPVPPFALRRELFGFARSDWPRERRLQGRRRRCPADAHGRRLLPWSGLLPPAHHRNKSTTHRAHPPTHPTSIIHRPSGPAALLPLLRRGRWHNSPLGKPLEVSQFRPAALCC